MGQCCVTGAPAPGKTIICYSKHQHGSGCQSPPLTVSLSRSLSESLRQNSHYHQQPDLLHIDHDDHHQDPRTPGTSYSSIMSQYSDGEEMLRMIRILLLEDFSPIPTLSGSRNVGKVVAGS